MSFTGREQSVLEREIDNGSFFPKLSVGHFQEAYRVPADRAEEIVVQQLMFAAFEINTALKEKRASWLKAGHATLLAAESEEDMPLTMLYLQAVYFQAKANLLSDFETFTRRSIAENTARDGEETEDDLRASSNRALRYLLGESPSLTVKMV